MYKYTKIKKNNEVSDGHVTQDACNPGKGRQGLEWEDQMVRCRLLLVCSPLSGGLSSAYYISQN